jgi:predicted metal-dependent hydrolase
VLQVAVAYLQIERGNPNGAKKIFLRSRQWLSPLPDTCRGVDVKQLKKDAAAVEQALKEEGVEAARKRFKRVVWKEIDRT